MVYNFVSYRIFISNLVAVKPFYSNILCIVFYMTTITSRHSIHASAGIVTNVCNALLKNEAVFPSQQTIYYSIGKLKDILHRGWAKKKENISFCVISKAVFADIRQSSAISREGERPAKKPRKLARKRGTHFRR